MAPRAGTPLRWRPCRAQWAALAAAAAAAARALARPRGGGEDPARERTRRVLCVRHTCSDEARAPPENGCGPARWIIQVDGVNGLAGPACQFRVSYADCGNHWAIMLGAYLCCNVIDSA